MTTPVEPPELPDDEFDALASMLSSAAVWDDPAPEIEDQLVAEIADEIGARPRMPSAPGRADRRHLRLIGAAAALFLVVGVGIALLVGGEDDTTVVALAGTELAPGASADAELEDLASGLRVVLDVSDLPPAEPGTYYQGWVRNDDGQGITIGTFHMRGGDAEIELWAGVSSADYPIITVTIQEEGAGPASSGMVVLRGRLDG
ncbi:MAG: anti-sigma factor [Actinomycetota bacterium]